MAWTAAAATVACPLCGSAGTRHFARNDIHVAECVGCGHRYADLAPGRTHVQQVYGDDYFTAGGAGYPDYLALTEVMQQRGRFYARILRRHGLVGGAVLDVGAAAGSLLSVLAGDGYRCIGIEPNERMVAEGRRRFGLDLRVASLEEFEPRAGERFDCILLLQVIAHVAAPAAAIERLVRWLRPGGRVLVETWDRRSWTARLAGRRWHEYSPPSVLQFFDRPAVDALFAAQGCAFVARGRPPKPMLGKHFKSAVVNALGVHRGVSALLHLLPDDSHIPYPGDDVYWALYRSPGSHAEPDGS